VKPRRFFDLTAPVYRYITWQDVWRDNCAEMAGLFPELRGARVADLGIGPGVSAIGFLEARPDVRVIGVDLSLNMLREAQAMCALPLVQADATRLPFADASFDVVAGHSFLYLVPDRRGVLAEARRILRPSGRLVLLEPRADGPWHRGALMSGPLRFRFSMVAWRMASARYGRFAEAELRDSLLRAGFARAEVMPTLGRMAWFATATP
jgi:ubiquinone/menaquinone biosynthesis C-methylase UbiE